MKENLLYAWGIVKSLVHEIATFLIILLHNLASITKELWADLKKILGK